MKSTTEKHLNPVLKKLGMREIRENPETSKVYVTSMDGTQVENWINDICSAFDDKMDTQTLWGLQMCKSSFLRAVTAAYKNCYTDSSSDYAQLVRALPVIKHWALAMRVAMRMKPLPEDYGEVKRLMALYVVNKLLLWPASNTWYDNECLYHLGEMHEQWGSLRLVSQEGMEAWQKKLNEVLRLSNSFANAGAIPKAVVRRGEKAKKEYIAERAENMPSSARWVFEQALLQHHSYLIDVHAARDLARKEERTMKFERFSTYWRRFMVAATFRHRLLARVRRGATRRAKAGVPQALACVQREDYGTLMEAHRAYDADVELTADDLDEKELRRQQDRGMRERYAALHESLKVFKVRQDPMGS